jgi:hypothetical protein
MQSPESTSKPRVNCPVGAHVCRCTQVIDLGNQHFQPGDDASHKLYLGFETCDLKHTFKDEKGPEPFMLQSEFAWFLVSSKKKTKLREFIESWKGSPFADDAAARAFDFEKLLGLAATLMVVHKARSDGSMKAVIAGIAPADSKTAPKPVNPLICYEIGMREGGTFSKLPPFLQKKLRESDEFRGVKPAAKAPETADDFASRTEEGEPDWGDTGGPATVPTGNEDFS